jgi:hypothetical protein
MLKMKRYALSFLTLTMALSSGMVFAEGLGTVASATADIGFGAPISISHTVSPVTGLTAGAVTNLAALANGVVSLTGETSHPTVAVTFADGVEGTDGSKRTITRKDGRDELKVRLNTRTADVGKLTLGNITDGITLHKAGTSDISGTFNYVIQVDGNQTVAAGNYIINLNAQRWNL